MEDASLPPARATTPIPPNLPPRPDKRVLILIYIHGFKGNETSFKEFPTDFQEALRLKLRKHTVHTHLYPKYKTKRQFSVATVNFCEWLRNTLRSYHRPLNTLDVILIGHSMGGSLASEATILLSRVTFQHNVIGVLGLDVPFLGVHPHVVTSGVAGLVKSGKPTDQVKLNRPNADIDSRSTSTLSLSETPYLSESKSPSQTSLSESNPDPKIQSNIVVPVPIVQNVSPRQSTESLTPKICTPPASPPVTEPRPPPPRTPSSTSVLRPPPSRTPSPTPPLQKKSSFKKTFTKAVQAIYNNRHDLGGAAPRYVWSHLEYGHILLDPAELKSQYDQLRQLPIRFANFYTCIPRKDGENKQGRVFCALPSGVARSMDGWEEVEMPEGMDEPTAHSAIFVKDNFPGYWDMVDMIAAKIVLWEAQMERH